MGGGGGGGGFSIKKALKKVENVAKVVYNPVGTAASLGVKKAGGSGTMANAASFLGASAASPSTGVGNFVGGEVAGFAGKNLVDKPKELKKEAAQFATDQANEQAGQLKRMKDREAQEGAESSAADDLAKRRRKQDQRKRSRQTILTDSLGGTGGEESRASLLGR